MAERRRPAAELAWASLLHLWNDGLTAALIVLLPFVAADLRLGYAQAALLRTAHLVALSAAQIPLAALTVTQIPLAALWGAVDEAEKERRSSARPPCRVGHFYARNAQEIGPRWRMLLTGEVYLAARATTVVRKHRELQTKIRIQMSPMVPVPDPARVTRLPRAYAGRRGR